MFSFCFFSCLNAIYANGMYECRMKLLRGIKQKLKHNWVIEIK